MQCVAMTPQKICMIGSDNSHYVHSLVNALSKVGLKVDLIADNLLESLEYDTSSVKILNFRGSTDPYVSIIAKINRIVKYYFLSTCYIWKSGIKIIDFQAFRFPIVEGVFWVLFFRLLGKKVVFTAHGLPKGKNNRFKRLKFYFIYRVVNGIICHTQQLKLDLIKTYKIKDNCIKIVPHVLNSSVPITKLSQSEARKRLGLNSYDKVLLIFGNLKPYKGVDKALQALAHLRHTQRLIMLVAGSVSKKDEPYLDKLMLYIKTHNLQSRVKVFPEFIPDHNIEIFFKAADVLLLPYTEGGFQSGVLFLAYTFGLPAIASDVGALQEEIAEGENGYVFKFGEPNGLALKICKFYQQLYVRPSLRKSIRELAQQKYCCENIARLTANIYRELAQLSKN